MKIGRGRGQKPFGLNCARLFQDVNGQKQFEESLVQGRDGQIRNQSLIGQSQVSTFIKKIVNRDDRESRFSIFQNIKGNTKKGFFYRPFSPRQNAFLTICPPLSSLTLARKYPHNNIFFLPLKRFQTPFQICPSLSSHHIYPSFSSPSPPHQTNNPANPPFFTTCFRVVRVFLQVLIRGMDNDEYANPKMQYSKITYNKRLRLIQMVELKHYSIYKASKQLGISNSTAKLIIKNYREEGRIFQKKEQRKTTEKKSSEELFSNEKNETMVKQEPSECPMVKTEPFSLEFHKLLSEITHLNREWLSIQIQKLA